MDDQLEEQSNDVVAIKPEDDMSGRSVDPESAVEEEKKYKDVKPLEDAKAEEKHYSMSEMARFSAGITAYRIVRLSVELFLVVRVQELNFSVSAAGTIYLLYSMASICAGLAFMWFPSICFGSLRNAITYFVGSVLCMFGGFLGTFHLQQESFGWMSALAMLTGFGSATWNINFQTMTNLSFPRAQLGSVARMRQLFECIGFLIPSICLATVMIQGHVNLTAVDTETTTDSDDSDERKESFVTLSATILAVVGFAFSLLSADQMIGNAARIQPNKGEEECNPSSGKDMGIWEALRGFFGTSVVKYFLLNSLLLAFSNILMGTMSLITELYFGLDPAWLWLAAIAFPIGGMISVGTSILFSSPLKKKNISAKDAVLAGLHKFIPFLLVCIALGFYSFHHEELTKALLFLFGLIIGMVYSTTFAASIELWLLRLKECTTSFVSRASVINNLAVQAVIACIFQLQTILVDATVVTTMEEEDLEEGGGNHTSAVAAAVFFGPLIGLCLVCLFLARTIPYPKDTIFGWPMPPCSFSTPLKMTVALLEWLGLSSAANSVFFSKFYDFRTSCLARHLEGTTVQRGPTMAESAALRAGDLEEHLKRFDQLGTEEKWRVSSHNNNEHPSATSLCNVLIDNEEALEKRLELIEKATSKIWIVTWLIEHSSSGEKLADALIRRAREGVEVKIMVDKVTMYYLYQKYVVRGMNDMKTVEKLAQAPGVEVRMLDKIHFDGDKNDSSFVIGNHRKIMLVDDDWMITGGRNNSDRYFATEGFHYHDADVLLNGSFGASTCALYGILWQQASDVHGLFGGEQGTPEASTTKNLKNRAQEDERSLPGSTELLVQEEDTNTITEMSLVELESAEEGLAPTTFGDNPVDGRTSIGLKEWGNQVTMFQLEHAAGNKDGHDITFTTLLFLIETAQERIDLVMGYFQLFPELETAIANAMRRGVHIRLATNSDLTNGIPAFNIVLRDALERLLELGVEVHTTANLTEYKDDGDFCLHYKVAIFDQKVALLGSWNCLGTSVFYDSDFSIVLFEEEKNPHEDAQHVFQPLEDLIDGGIKAGRLVPLQEISEGSFKIPFYFYLLLPFYKMMIFCKIIEKFVFSQHFIKRVVT